VYCVLPSIYRMTTTHISFINLLWHTLISNGIQYAFLTEYSEERNQMVNLEIEIPCSESNQSRSSMFLCTHICGDINDERELMALEIQMLQTIYGVRVIDFNSHKTQVVQLKFYLQPTTFTHKIQKLPFSLCHLHRSRVWWCLINQSKL
jgi:hypothetical protein